MADDNRSDQANDGTAGKVTITMRGPGAVFFGDVRIRIEHDQARREVRKIVAAPRRLRR